jgi:integrase/recombinase XerD
MKSNKKEVIRLELISHRGLKCVAIRFGFNHDVLNRLRVFQDLQFSKTNKCWYIVYRDSVGVEIKRALGDIAIVENNLVHIKNQLIDETQAIPEETFIRVLRSIEEKMILKGYSRTSRNTYIAQFKLFLQFHKAVPPAELNQEQVRDYILHLREKRKLSKSSQNQAINAIKFYYEKVLAQDRKIYALDRPMRDRSLPIVMSEEEVWRILNVEQNPKHRLMLMMIYSAGLRRSELLNLRRGDIDVDRGIIFVKGGKGKKDRQTILAKSVLPLIENYLRATTTNYWFFEGEKGKAYSASSLQSIFRRAVRKAGIEKEVHLHTLRHSFATHLLEAGTSTRYIQELLGHDSPITTEIYTRVTRVALEKIKSPLDRIFRDASNANTEESI